MCAERVVTHVGIFCDFVFVSSVSGFCACSTALNNRQNVSRKPCFNIEIYFRVITNKKSRLLEAGFIISIIYNIYSSFLYTYDLPLHFIAKVKKEKGEKYGVHCCHYLFCFVILYCKSSIIFAKRKRFAIILSHIPTFCRFKRHLHYYSDCYGVIMQVKYTVG